MAASRSRTVSPESGDQRASAPTCRAVRLSARPREARVGDELTVQGDDGLEFFVIVEGDASAAVDGNEVGTIGPGGFFGEMALIDGGERVATVTATTPLKLLVLDRHDFNEMLERFPQVRTSLQTVADERLAENRSRMSKLQKVPIDDFLKQGLLDAQSLLVLDLDRCTRCDQCVKACADAHDGITRLIRDGLRFDRYLVATSCRQCRDPLCMVGCPVGSIRRRNSLEVIIEDWCVGCGLCANNCPYGNINLHEFVVEGSRENGY